MAKSNINDRNSKRVKVNTVQLRDTVKLVLLQPSSVRAIGSVTGTEYFWSGAGSIVEVDAEDADELLKKRTYNCGNCPNSSSPSPYFELVR